MSKGKKIEQFGIEMRSLYWGELKSESYPIRKKEKYSGKEAGEEGG